MSGWSMALSLQHQTTSEFAARFWLNLKAAFDSGDRLRYHFMVWWVWNRIQIGDLTNDQVRVSYNTFFGKALTLAQWNSLVTARFIPIKDRYLAWIAETLV